MGTRFLPTTKAIPKELLPIVDTPGLQLVCEEAVGAGIETVIVVSHPDKAAVEAYFAPRPELIESLQAAGKHELVERLQRVERARRAVRPPTGAAGARSRRRRRGRDGRRRAVRGAVARRADGRLGPALGDDRRLREDRWIGRRAEAGAPRAGRRLWRRRPVGARDGGRPGAAHRHGGEALPGRGAERLRDHRPLPLHARGDGRDRPPAAGGRRRTAAHRCAAGGLRVPAVPRVGRRRAGRGVRAPRHRQPGRVAGGQRPAGPDRPDLRARPARSSRRASSPRVSAAPRARRGSRRRRRPRAPRRSRASALAGRRGTRCPRSPPRRSRRARVGALR